MRDSTEPASSPEAFQNKEREIAQTILNALRGMRFGSVEITVHDAKVVQIERKEKIRLEAMANQKGR